MKETFDLEERKRLWACGEILKHFPIVFSNGHKWTKMHGNCGQCKKEIPTELLHGEVNETFKDIFNLKMIGLCPDCRLATCYEWNIKPNGMSGRDFRGNWRNYELKKVSKFKEFFNRLLHRD